MKNRKSARHVGSVTRICFVYRHGCAFVTEGEAGVDGVVERNDPSAHEGREGEGTCATCPRYEGGWGGSGGGRGGIRGGR